MLFSKEGRNSIIFCILLFCSIIVIIIYTDTDTDILEYYTNNNKLICEDGKYNSNGVCCDNNQYNNGDGVCVNFLKYEHISNKDANMCRNGQYEINGLCCPIGTVNVKGNCMAKDEATSKYQKDISLLIDMDYHKTDEQLMSESRPTDVQFGNTYIYDENGNKIPYPFSSVQGDITYYRPGSYPLGTTNYVPNYEDSIYLSKLTGQSTTTPVYNTANILGGFCSYFEEQPQEKETVCNQLDPNHCGSTNCCVLLGGAKCVAGNESGPTYTNNYGDVFLRNKDFYYYQGKCYGNCQ